MTHNLLKEIFEDIEKYESRYGIAIPIQAYLRIKKKWEDKLGFGGDNISSSNIYLGYKMSDLQ